MAFPTTGHAIGFLPDPITYLGLFLSDYLPYNLKVNQQSNVTSVKKFLVNGRYDGISPDIRNNLLVVASYNFIML